MTVAHTIFRILFGRRLPITGGTLALAGIRDPLTIRRDGYGIAYIEAGNDEDAWYGLGFCHGQDRAFQLETLLRIEQGTMAEMVGSAALPLDRLSRRIGFHYSALQQIGVLDEEIRLQLHAYCRGISAGMASGGERPAHEFALLRTRPTPWEAADVLGVLKLMSFLLSTNWDRELTRLKVLQEDGSEALAALDSGYRSYHPLIEPPTRPAGQAIDHLARDLALLTAAVPMGGGSNNWAVGAQHTAAGRVLVANDPHLAPTLPPHWYLAQVRTPDWVTCGASFVGGPTFPAGFNGFYAWGVTAASIDNTDLFVEEIGRDGTSVRQRDGFQPCIERVELIQVKGGDSVEERVLETPRGPIIGPALEGEVGAISLRAVWLDAMPVKGLLSLHRAGSFDEFRSVCQTWPVTPQNVVYGDVNGRIGYQVAGQAPMRRTGFGTLPLPGAHPEAGWQSELLPAEEIPYLVDPPSGFVVTANNKPRTDEGNSFVGVDWCDGYRAARILDVLGSRSDWDLAGTVALQMDQTCNLWPDLRAAVLAVEGNGETAQQALALLSEWDGVAGADSTGAAIFELFLAAMVTRIVTAKAPRSAPWILGRGFTPLTPDGMMYAFQISGLADLIRHQPADWFETSWQDEMRGALNDAVARLRADHGPDPRRWQWGRVRTLTLRHPVGERAPLDRIYNLGPFPWGGDVDTVNQASNRFDDPTGNPKFIASMRMAVEVGNWENNRFSLPGGQSGNPLSDHYADLLPLWQSGRGVSMAWTPGQVRQQTRATLKLVPNGDGSS